MGREKISLEETAYKIIDRIVKDTITSIAEPINPMKMNITNEFLKSEIQSTINILYDGEDINIDAEEINNLIDIVLEDDQLWNDFHFNLRDIIEDYFNNK